MQKCLRVGLDNDYTVKLDYFIDKKTNLQDIGARLSERVDSRIQNHEILGKLLVALDNGEPVLEVFQRDILNLFAGHFAKLVQYVNIVNAMLAPGRD